ncbi:DUF7601 domain-containing protein [Globicatella sanguinis]|uniref:DUF7601 domain-containing protein n=1 Tax=Globicatella sanguinis TaxID=13076 RepID=UPI000824EF0A|nr:FctA domain-containing protein [Globicatella sanguinis]
MKKTLLKGITLLALLGSSITGVFAQEETSLAQTGNEITFNKKYVEEGDTAKAPAEEFKFTISAVGVTDSTVTDVPTATIGTTSFDSTNPNDTLPVKITLPEYLAVGVYTYEIKETTGTTAGVTYDNSTAYLRVYVTQNDDGSFSTSSVIYSTLPTEETDINEGKTDTPFQNKYEAGSLEVKKEVKGNLGERDREFPITITLNAPEGLNVTSTILVDGEDKQITFDNGVATISDLTIKHGQTIKLSNLPKGTTYTISEKQPDDYQTPKITNDGKGSIENTENDEVTITNTKDQLIPTGVIIENLPYIVLLVLAIAGLGFFLFKKRQNNHLN